jgi:hypothetical protein
MERHRGTVLRVFWRALTMMVLLGVAFNAQLSSARQQVMDLPAGDELAVTCATTITSVMEGGKLIVRCAPPPAPVPTVPATGPRLNGLTGVTEGQKLSGTVAIEALASGAKEVVFKLDGPKPVQHTERIARYFFMGDVENKPKGWDTTAFPNGAYMLTVTARDGTASTSLMVHFEIANSAAPQPTVVPLPTAAPILQPPQNTGHPQGCKPGEIYVDAQNWWVSTPGKVGGDGKAGQDFGHLHTALCFPHKATITGKISLKVRSIMHNNPGQFYRLMVQIADDRVAPEPKGCGGDSMAVACLTFDPPRTCPVNQTCVWEDTLVVDTRMIKHDGWQQFRVRGFVHERGKNGETESMRTSTGLHAYVKNGNPRDDVYENPDVLEARGWYTHANYMIANIVNPPLGPVSGVWQPKVTMNKGAEGIEVTSWYAALDTDFHHGNVGTALCPNGVRGSGHMLSCGNGPLRGQLTIDTTKLSDGWHRLFLKTNAFEPKTGSTSSGVLAILFEVRNGRQKQAEAAPAAPLQIVDDVVVGTGDAPAP